MGIILFPIILIALIVYIGVFIGLFVFVKNALGRTLVAAFFIGIPFFLVYGYQLGPDYRKFKGLCKATDRKVVHQTRAVDYLFVNDGTRCGAVDEYLARFKGIECSDSSLRASFRYSKGQQWNQACTSRCSSIHAPSERDRCKLSCTEKSPIADITNPYERLRSRKAVIEDKLSLLETRFVEGDVVLGAVRNYQFLPYGNSWARILGGSSGAAPSESCPESMDLSILDIYRPK